MRDRRLLIGLGVLVALVALFLVFRPGDDEEGAGTTTTAVTAPPTLEPTTTQTTTEAAPPPLPKARSSW